MPKPHPLAARLRQARLDAGLTQAHVADHVRVSHNTICNWERGKAEPSLAHLDAWADALGQRVALGRRDR